jgi:hypothetical protein
VICKDDIRVLKLLNCCNRYCLHYVMARADAAEAYAQMKVLSVAAVLLKRGW